MIRKHPLVIAFVVLIASGLALVMIGSRWLKAERTQTLGALSDDSGKFRAREITGVQAGNMGALVDPPIQESRTGARGRVHYFADGCSLSDPAAANRQANWVCLFNPAKKAARVKFTFYYEEGDPTHLDYEVPAESVKSIGLYDRKEVLHNRRFGAKIETSEPMVVQVSTGYYGEGDKADLYTRAMHSIICTDTLSRINYYADGLVIDREGIRLKEPEWAFLLNPNPEPAKVLFYAYYTDGQKKIYALEIEPQRLFPLRMDDLVIKNKLFGAKFVSNVPIAIQQTRWVEETNRKTIRSVYSVMALPGDLSGVGDRINGDKIADDRFAK